MRRRSRPQTEMSSAAVSAQATALFARRGGIGHLAVVTALLVLLALFTVSPSAQAQDETTMVAHPAVGSWSIDPDVEDPES